MCKSQERNVSDGHFSFIQKFNKALLESKDFRKHAEMDEIVKVQKLDW